MAYSTSQLKGAILSVDGRPLDGGAVELPPNARLLLDLLVEETTDRGLLDELSAAVDEAKAARDQAVDISNIDTTDAAVDAALQLPGGQAAATLTATIGAEVPPIAQAAAADYLASQPGVEAAAANAVGDQLAAGGVTYARGTLASGTDLDTLTSQPAFGVYQLTSSGTYANRPSGTSGVALLEVHGSPNAVVQRIIHTGLGYHWVRTKLSAGSWSAWSPAYASRGTLASGTNLGTMTSASNGGFYRLTAANTYPGAPAAAIDATLEVVVSSSGVTQRLTLAGGLWQRFYNGTAWSPWEWFAPARHFVGSTDPEPQLPSGAEYVWHKTDGAGTLLDILVGKKA